jgi:hypothetical protein
MLEPPDALRSDLGLVRTNRSIEADAEILERGHCLTLHFNKQSSVRARINFAPTSTSTEAGVVQSQAMTPCFFHTSLMTPYFFE